jgi:hypothetical protein
VSQAFCICLEGLKKPLKTVLGCLTEILYSAINKIHCVNFMQSEIHANIKATSAASQ